MQLGNYNLIVLGNRLVESNTGHELQSYSFRSHRIAVLPPLPQKRALPT